MNRWKCLPFVACLALAVSIPACKSDAEQPKEKGMALMDESQRILAKDAFADAIKKKNTVIVDLRYPFEFEQSHIPNAININFFDHDFKWKILELDKEKKIFLYGKNENTSYRAMKFLEDNAYPHVFMLKGGYQDWNTATDQQ
jgi:rhodanese-related sulfurtransferase